VSHRKKKSGSSQPSAAEIFAMLSIGSLSKKDEARFDAILLRTVQAGIPADDVKFLVTYLMAQGGRAVYEAWQKIPHN
jgi:hypothetical protein